MNCTLSVARASVSSAVMRESSSLTLCISECLWGLNDIMKVKLPWEERLQTEVLKPSFLWQRHLALPNGLVPQKGKNEVVFQQQFLVFPINTLVQGRPVQRVTFKTDDWFLNPETNERTCAPPLPTRTPAPWFNVPDILPHRAPPENRDSGLLFCFCFFLTLEK